MSYGFRNTHIRLIVYLLTQFPEIEKVVLYGPRTKRGYSPSPEVDFVLIGERIDLNLKQELLQRLNNLLLPYTFELTIYNHLLDFDLIDRIDKTGASFYKRDSPVLQTM